MSAPQPPPRPSRWRWAGRPFSLNVTMIATIVLVAAAAGALATGEFDTFPIWLEAYATFIALVAAVFAARYAAGAFHLETLREDRWLDEQRRAQADLVGAWYDAERFDQQVGETPSIAMVNASPLPVYDVEVVLVGFPGLTTDEVNDEVDYLANAPDTLGPSGGAPIFIALEGHQRRAAFKAREIHPRPSVQLTFTDARGTRWLRRTDGKLLRTADEWETW